MPEFSKINAQPSTSPEQTRRILAALAETVSLLDREMAYQPHLRDAANISFYTTHIEKLSALIRRAIALMEV